MICIPITADTVAGARKEVKEAQALADILELRLDYIEDIDETDVQVLIDASKKPVIVTCRPGKKNKTELLKAALGKADYVDIEVDSDFAEILEKKASTRIILSHHDHDKTPDNLESLYERMNRQGADLIKIVTMAESINDNFKIFELLKGKENLIAFCMGLEGQLSRILARKYGSRMTYASLHKPSAPGQIQVNEFNVYNPGDMDAGTQVLGVIGSHAENSQSKYMHNACFKEQGLNYVYVPFKVQPAELETFMELFWEFQFKGAAVTIPHKQTIMQHIDAVHETAQTIGACNTLVQDEQVRGYNTDYFGAVEALKEKISLQDKKVVVLGAGGAARAIVYGLIKEEAEVTVLNRTIGKARLLAEKFGAEFGSLEDIDKVRTHDIIINATDVGMEEDKSLVPAEVLEKKHIVMDIVYTPIMTRLIRDATKKGCGVITGDKMLLHQALGQYRFWTGKEPDRGLMQTKLKEQVEQ